MDETKPKIFDILFNDFLIFSREILMPVRSFQIFDAFDYRLL